LPSESQKKGRGRTIRREKSWRKKKKEGKGSGKYPSASQLHGQEIPITKNVLQLEKRHDKIKGGELWGKMVGGSTLRSADGEESGGKKFFV